MAFCNRRDNGVLGKVEGEYRALQLEGASTLSSELTAEHHAISTMHGKEAKTRQRMRLFTIEFILTSYSCQQKTKWCKYNSG